MKILVADKISPKGVAFLRQQAGFEVVEAYGSSPAQILDLVKDVHAIAVRSETKITKEVFEEAVRYAGTAVGVGRFRPERGGFFGRYAVDKFEWGG